MKGFFGKLPKDRFRDVTQGPYRRAFVRVLEELRHLVPPKGRRFVFR